MRQEHRKEYPMNEISAQQVHRDQQAHVDLCNERWGELRRSLGEFKTDVKNGIDDMRGSLRAFWWVLLVSAGSLVLMFITIAFNVSLRTHP